MLFGDIYTKSKTYQKEGWFILEEENQVFGKNAEAVVSNINLESEDFNFYHQNKEEAKKNIDNSTEDLSDFIGSLVQDIPDPSEEDINAGIEKILERTRSTEDQTEPSKTKKSKKRTLWTLFIAALLLTFSCSCFYAVGSSHNISIENGFASFAKDTIQIVFFGVDKEEYISVDALLADLEAHGYEDILFPQEFVNNYDEYKVSVPKYHNIDGKQVSFEVCGENLVYDFTINEYKEIQKTIHSNEMDNASTVEVRGIYIYIFEHGNNSSSIQFANNNYRYNVHTYAPYSEIVEMIQTIR